MKDSMKQSNLVDKAGAAWSEVRKAAFVAMFALLPASAWAQDAIGENGAVCKFFSNINNILNIASIAVVTIAVIFAGYQHAFAPRSEKRRGGEEWVCKGISRGCPDL